MARIAGINIPQNKLVDITYIHGIVFILLEKYVKN